MPAVSQPQSHARHPLTSILGSAGNVRVLRALTIDRAPQSAPQISRAAGLSPRGTRLVLEALTSQHVIDVHGAGRAQVYVLNDRHPFASALSTLFAEEHRRWGSLLETLHRTLVDQGADVRAAWLYGSVARGEDTPRSDLDIAAVVTAPKVADRLRESFMTLEDEQQVHVSLTALTLDELAALPERDRWWSEVVRDGRVLKGPAPEAAKRQATNATSIATTATNREPATRRPDKPSSKRAGTAKAVT